MSSRLDQSEVDALMQAIQEGRVGSETGSGSGAPILNYDLTSQDRIIRGQLPTLDSIDDRIASLFTGAVGARMRLDVRVTAPPATLLKFADVTALIAPPAVVGLMALGPGHGLAILSLDAQLAKAMVAGALGDRKARTDAGDGETKNDLTSVERVVLKHVTGLFSDAMAQAWSEILDFHPEILRWETDPRMAVVAAPTELAILCAFELSGAASGRLQVFIPYATVEPVKKLLTSPPRPSGGVDARFQKAFKRELTQVDVELRAELGRARMPFSKLLELQVGDLLVLDSNEASPVPVFVQGRKKMTGWPRVVNGSMGVVIEQPMQASADLELPAALKPKPAPNADGKASLVRGIAHA